VQRLALLVGDVEDATRAGHAMRRSLVPGAGDDVGVEPVVSVSGPGVVCDAVKLADDGTGDLVVRFHESVGARTVAVLRASVPVSEHATCDLLERPADDDAWTAAVGDRHSVEAALRPHELRTLRLRRA
jgi:alpha-mannosidase